jgi:hypothetical protein
MFMNIGMTADYAGPQFLRPNIVRAVGQAFVLTRRLGLRPADTPAARRAGALLPGPRRRPADGRHKAIIAVGRAVQKQAFVMSFSDTFCLLGAALLVALAATLLLNPMRHQGSTHRRQTGILVDVHPGSSAGTGVSQLQLRSSASPGEQPS